MFGGRWNSPGRSVIYTATSLAGAKLELLAQGGGFGLLPKGYSYVTIIVPEQVAVIRYPYRNPPRQEQASQLYGDEWMDSSASLILLVPSAASPGDWNGLINPAHSDFPLLSISKEYKVKWDKRHFKS